MKSRAAVLVILLGVSFAFTSARAAAFRPPRGVADLLPPLPLGTKTAVLNPMSVEKPRNVPVLDFDRLQADLTKKFEPIIKIVNHIDDLEVSNGQYKFVYKTSL